MSQVDFSMHLKEVFEQSHRFWWWCAAQEEGKYVVGDGDDHLTAPLDKEDAILIAAAPKLLEALRWAVDEIKEPTDPDDKERLEAVRYLVKRLSNV